MTSAGLAIAEPAWEAGPDDILLGVDIIELVSSSMYVDALTAYREYVQNSADAIDDARERGLDAGRIDITIEPATRSVRIRDNGTGLSHDSFVRRLTAFGASGKRQQQRRGFRGVGRLAALGQCQELIFRSQTDGERVISELRWDGRLLRSLLRGSEFEGSLAEAVRSATSHRRLVTKTVDRFFEVELRGIVRHGRDDLLNESVVRQYLSEVGPVPFSPTFAHGPALNAFLQEHGVRADIEIYVNGAGPLYRPHGDAIPIKEGVSISVLPPEFFEIPGVDGELAGCGWVMHHEYLGAIPCSAGVRGVRLRSSNIQVGDDDILVELFAEPRFNAWSVAEVHVLDRRVVPNGRRDNYEQSTHFANVVNYIAPIARTITSRCRSESQHRQVLRNATLLEDRIGRDLAILKQGAITHAARTSLIADIETTLQKLEKIAYHAMLTPPERAEMHHRRRNLEAQLARRESSKRRATSLKKLSPQKRRAFEEVFSIIYACAPDSRAAKDLVERVLARLS